MNDTAGSYVTEGQAFERDMDYIPDRITAKPDRSPGPVRGVRGRGADLAGRAGPLPAGRGEGLPVGEPLDHRAQPARARRTSSRWAWPGRPTTRDSWTFDLDEGGRDPVLGIEKLQEAYVNRIPDYPKGITVPAVVEIETGKVVTNDFPQITHDFFFEWRDHHRPDAPDLWPDDLRDEMEEVMERVFTEVNNGVYRCGFAGSQEAYDEAYDRLWTAMDWLEERLTDRRYLMGDAVTEADVRLFTTLARFDAVYHAHFKCNRNQLKEMPALWGYARDLYQMPGFGETIDFEQIKAHYYVVQTDINPTKIVPKGPDPAAWLEPHGRG